MEREQVLEISPEIGTVHTLWNFADHPIAAMTLAHGAGAGMHHEFMESIATRLARLGIHVLRFQFPYMENGSGRPDRPDTAMATVGAALQEVQRNFPQLPVFASGKSFGGRMSSMYAARQAFPWLKGLIYWGFPLHLIGKPTLDRTRHLPDIHVPQLFLQGERDAHAEIGLIRQVCAGLSSSTLIEYPMADHSFKRPKKSGYTQEQTLDLLTIDAFAWIKQVLAE